MYTLHPVSKRISSDLSVYKISMGNRNRRQKKMSMVAQNRIKTETKGIEDLSDLETCYS